MSEGKRRHTAAGARADPRRAGREHLRRVDPVIARLIDEQPDFDPRAWLEQLPKMDAFGVLIFQVVGQQLSLAATRAILERITALCDGRLPTAQEMLELSPERLHRAGLSRRKVTTLRAIASRFCDGSLSERALSRLGDGEIEAELTEIPGVGPWTAHGFLIVALDRPDVILPGDVALRRAVKIAYGLDHTPGEAEMLLIAEPWRPYRSLAVGYLFGSLFGSDDRGDGRSRRARAEPQRSDVAANART